MALGGRYEGMDSRECSDWAVGLGALQAVMVFFGAVACGLCCCSWIGVRGPGLDTTSVFSVLKAAEFLFRVGTGFRFELGGGVGVLQSVCTSAAATHVGVAAATCLQINQFVQSSAPTHHAILAWH